VPATKIIDAIADLGDQDKIAMPSLTLPHAIRMVAMLGIGQWRVDKMMISLPQPATVAALLAGRESPAQWLRRTMFPR
jgi:hypothetical protein